MSLLSVVRRGAARVVGRSVATRAFSSSADVVKVFGHKNPDTDATVGAILRSWELEKLGTSTAEM